MIFIGYEKGVKGYRTFNPFSQTIPITRDAVFEEEKSWNWEEFNQDSPAGMLTSEYSSYVNLDSNNSEMPTVTSSQDSITENSGNFSASPLSSSSSARSQPCKFKELSQLYEETQPMNEEEAFLLSEEEPGNFLEALREKVWKAAMEEEFNQIQKNNTLSLVTPLASCKPIGLKWVFKVKKDSSGQLTKHKAQLVVKGYAQRYGIDFTDVFAPVARMETIRVLLALAAVFDVKSSFLNGEILEEIYIKQLEGYEIPRKEHHVYKLRKALYGLKQAPRAWYSKLDKSLLELGLIRSNHEPAVYYNPSNLYIGVYVDDLLVAGSSKERILEFKDKMKSLFDMTDFGLLKSYLGIQVNQLEGEITLAQSSYARKILSDFNLLECNSSQTPLKVKTMLSQDDSKNPVDSTTYRSLMGSLRYLTHTRPDLMFCTGYLSRYMESPSKEHFTSAKRVLRYVKGTLNLGLSYKQGRELYLVGYCDSDYGGDSVDRKSTSGAFFFLGDNIITWMSQKQRIVALSACEAEYISLTLAACQGVWLADLIAELTGRCVKPVRIFVDNKSAIDLAKNTVFHSRSKHIKIRYHYVRTCVQSGDVEVIHIPSTEQRADI